MATIPESWGWSLNGGTSSAADMLIFYFGVGVSLKSKSTSVVDSSSTFVIFV